MHNRSILVKIMIVELLTEEEETIFSKQSGNVYNSCIELHEERISKLCTNSGIICIICSVLELTVHGVGNVAHCKKLKMLFSKLCAIHSIKIDIISKTREFSC